MYIYYIYMCTYICMYTILFPVLNVSISQLLHILLRHFLSDCMKNIIYGNILLKFSNFSL